MVRAVVIALVIGLAGCGATRPAWLGGGSVVGETFYAGVNGLAVHEEASGSAAVVGRLALHERVTRSELVRGYAHIVGASGVAGWVDNAKLVWRIPQAKTAAAPSAPSAGASAVPSRSPDTPASAPTAGPAAAEDANARPAETPAAAPSPASATSESPAAVPARDVTPPPTTPPARALPRAYDPF